MLGQALQAFNMLLGTWTPPRGTGELAQLLEPVKHTSVSEKGHLSRRAQGELEGLQSRSCLTDAQRLQAIQRRDASFS